MLDLKSHRVYYHPSTRVQFWWDFFSTQQQVKEAALDGHRNIQSTCIDASKLTHARETASQLGCTFSRDCAQHALRDNWISHTHTHSLAHGNMIQRMWANNNCLFFLLHTSGSLCKYMLTREGLSMCKQIETDGLENFNIHVQPIAHTHTEGLRRAVEDRRTDSVCAIIFTHGLCHI